MKQKKWKAMMKFISAAIENPREQLRARGYEYLLALICGIKKKNSSLTEEQREELSFLRTSIIDKTVERFCSTDFNQDELDIFTALLLSPKEQQILFCTDWSQPFCYSPVTYFRDDLWGGILKHIRDSAEKDKTERLKQWFYRSCGLSVKRRYYIWEMGKEDKEYPIYCTFYMTTLIIRLFVSNVSEAQNSIIVFDDAKRTYKELINMDNNGNNGVSHLDPKLAEKFVLWYILFLVANGVQDLRDKDGYYALEEFINEEWEQWGNLRIETIFSQKKFQRGFINQVEKIIKNSYPIADNDCTNAMIVIANSICNNLIELDSTWCNKQEKINQLMEVFSI